MVESVPKDICVIEDDADQRRLLVTFLEREGFSVSAAADLTSGLTSLQHEPSKVVLCDFDLPDCEVDDLAGLLRHRPEHPNCYFILMSASSLCDLPAEMLNIGTDDFLAKPINRRELSARVRVGVRMWTMHNRLRHAAITDGLTGLYNHDHFNRILEAEMGRSRRYGHPLAIIMMDLDFFKAINDTFGHLAGNSTLEDVARILRDGVRDVDVPTRFGGDEFAILLPEARTSDALQVAERIRAALKVSLRVEAIKDHEVTASFGIADSDDPRVKTAAALVDLADRALYQAKHQGRDQLACGHDVGDVVGVTESIQTDEVDRLRRRLTALSVRTKDVYMQSVESLLQALDEKDPYTARHSVNVAFYAQQIAEGVGCSRAIVKAVYNAALLHDIGKVGVPDRILMKRSSLTALERMVVDQVPLIGTRIVDHLRILETEVQIIRHQREYYDGSGLPSGLKGDQIPIGSQVLLVADAFDAMTTDRVYRRRRSIDDVVAEIVGLSGKQFSPRAVTAMSQILQENRNLWKQRIEETIQAMRLPANDRLCEVKGFHVPDPANWDPV